MRILYVITKSEIGGAQTHVLQLAKAMSVRGYSVAVMAGAGGWLENEIEKLGIRFYYCAHFSNNLFNILDLIHSSKTVGQVVSDFEPDLIACHSSVAGFVTRATIKGKIPTVFTVHGWGFTPGVPFWRKVIALFSEKLVARYASKIICVSKHDAKLAIKHRVVKEDKLIIIHNGVELKEKLKLNKFHDKIFEIVFVGRLAPPKRPEILINAFDNVCSGQGIDLKLRIIGDGPDMNKLKSLTKRLRAEGKINISGAKTPDQVLAILSNTHIFVLPSDWESFPMTILEAMSKGNVVIASDVGGVRELVTKDVGILLKNNEQEELELAIKNIVDSRSAIRNMAISAADRVRKKFLLATMLDKTEEVYKEIIENNSSTPSAQNYLGSFK